MERIIKKKLPLHRRELFKNRLGNHKNENKMEKLTQEQRTQIALEEYGKEPVNFIAHLAILKLAEMGISTGAENVIQTTNATFNNKRYSLEMTITYTEIKP